VSAEKKLHALEGLGYVAAVMIGAGGITKSVVLDYFNVLGLTFAVIVIVRLMVMDISARQTPNLFEAGEGGKAELE
jgi:hypothetical protein